jgi:hypothetical protein
VLNWSFLARGADNSLEPTPDYVRKYCWEIKNHALLSSFEICPILHRGMISMAQEQRPMELFISLIVETCVVVALFYFYRTYRLPVGLVGSLFGFLLFLFITIRKYSSMNKPTRIGSVGLTVSFLILSVLFGVKYYVTDITISQLYVGIILLVPVIIMQYLKKKEKGTAKNMT